MTADRGRFILSVLSAGAGVIHLAVIGPHFEESVMYGAFFLLVSAFQLIWAGLILGQSDRSVLVAGLAVNLVVILIWLLSRTMGVLVGPAAGGPERVSLADAVASGFEGLLVIGALLLLRRPSPIRLPIAVPWGVGLLSLFLTFVAVFGGFGASSAFSHHDEPAQGESSGEHAPGFHVDESQP